MGFPVNFQWFYTMYFISGLAHRLEVFSRWRRTRIADCPIKKDIDQGSDNDLKKEDEDLENNGSDCSLLETPD